MKILHINDLAGVAGVLCKYLRKAGHQADLISFMQDKDFGFVDFYGGRRFEDQRIMMAVLQGLIPKYDIIHVHFSYPLLEWLYQFDKPIVMHYHGTEIALNHMDARMLDYKCKLVLVAGEQLLQYHTRAEYLPTIVDTEHFREVPVPKTEQWLAFDVSYIDKQKVIEKVKEVYSWGGTNIKFVDREKNVVPHQDLPKFLSHYDGFIDIRYHKQRGLLTDRSKTGLEALACGLKVLTTDGWITELPERHKPEIVVNNLLEKYERVLKQ